MQIDYDKIWKNKWGGPQDMGPTHAHSRRLAIKMISGLDFSNILDVGCGNGKNLEFLKSKFPKLQYSGVDISEEALGEARKRLPEASFYRLDVEKECLDRTFDIIYSSDVVEHLQDDEAALANIYKMTNKYLLVGTLQGRMRNFEKNIGHVRNYAPGELERKIEGAGFRILKKTEWGFPFYSPLYRNILDIGGVNDMTGGRPGPMKRIISLLIYFLFFFNSSKKGDIIYILAAK